MKAVLRPKTLCRSSCLSVHLFSSEMRVCWQQLAITMPTYSFRGMRLFSYWKEWELSNRFQTTSTSREEATGGSLGCLFRCKNRITANLHTKAMAFSFQGWHYLSCSACLPLLQEHLFQTQLIVYLRHHSEVIFRRSLIVGCAWALRSLHFLMCYRHIPAAF